MADDLAQQTCARALDQAASFIPGTHFDRWMFTIARRAWLNDVRATKVRRGAGLVSIEDSDHAAEKPDVETNIFASEVFKQVQALPEGQRLAVLLVYVEGHSYKDAAETLDVPIGTIMSRLSAARKALAPLNRTETDT